MTAANRSDRDFRGIMADRARKVDEVCDCFEAAWKVGQRPEIEAFIGFAAEPALTLLLRELIALDVAYRRLRGESPRLAEYQARFPSRDAGWLELAMDGVDPPLHVSGDPASESDTRFAAESDVIRAGSRQTGVPAAWSEERPRTLGKFELIERVGAGAFGSVWRAHDSQLGRVVAIKVPHSELIHDARDIERIYREARTVAQLRHPGIVSVHEIYLHAGLPILVSDFVVGTTLRELLKQRRLTPREAAELIAKVADALAYAHALGAIHRDIKPANIMIDDESAEAIARGRDRSRTEQGAPRENAESKSGGRMPAAREGARPLGEPRIVDFGLAFRDNESAPWTQSGQLVGTPLYMSPEQACDGPSKIDGRADVFSLGVVLYETLTGVLPFEGTRSQIVRQRANDERPRLRQLDRRISRDLEMICHKAMARDPAQRYRSARDLADDLRRYLDGESVRARPVSLVERGWRFARRRPAEAAAAAMVAITALTVVALAVGSRYHVQLMHQYARIDRAREAEAIARSRAVTYQYYNRMALAEREYSANNIERVTRLLDDCPPALRGWEWSYLERRCHQELLTVRHDSTPSESTSVTRVVYSPDGRQLATASRDGLVRLWDSSSGVMMCVVGQHDGGCLAVAFHPDGSRLASGGADGLVKIWDRATGRLLRTLEGHSKVVYCVAYSPDGFRLASGDGFPPWEAVEHLRSPGVVRVWNEAKGTLQFSLAGHSQNVMGMAFRPDGRQLATVSGGALAVPIVKNKPGELFLWDMENGTRIREVKGHDGPLTSVAFSPDGKTLATSSWDWTSRLWDADTGNWRSTLVGHRDWVSQVAFDPAGEHLATAGADGAVQLWNRATGEPLVTFRGHTQKVTCVAFDPRGQRLASASSDQTVKVWNLSKNPEGYLWQGSAPVVDLAFLAGSRRLILAANREQKDGRIQPMVTLVDPMIGKSANLGGECIPVGVNINGLALDAAGRRVALTFSNTKTEVRDVATGGTIHTFLAPDQGQVQSVVFSPDGTTIAVVGMAQRPTVYGPLTTHDLGSYLALWDVSTGENRWSRISFDRGNIRSVDFSPDGRLIATADNEGTATLWDTASGAPVRSLHGHRRVVSSIAFSPDGQRLASASWDQTGLIWDAQTGHQLLTLRGHMRAVLCVAFSPDGTRVATGSEDQTVKLWDAATGEEVLTLRGHKGLVSSLAFSSDGRLLASAGADGVVLVREADPVQSDPKNRRVAHE